MAHDHDEHNHEAHGGPSHSHAPNNFGRAFAIGIAINTATALLFMSGRKGDLNIRGAFLHMVADAAVSAGVVLAGFALLATGWLWLDPVVNLLIVAVIVWGTWGLLRDSVNLALDAVPEGIEVGKVKDYLSALPAVTEEHRANISKAQKLRWARRKPQS